MRRFETFGTHSCQHARALLNSSTASQEGCDENHGSYDYRQNRGDPEIRRQGVRGITVVEFVQNPNNHQRQARQLQGKIAFSRFLKITAFHIKVIVVDYARMSKVSTQRAIRTNALYL